MNYYIILIIIILIIVGFMKRLFLISDTKRDIDEVNSYHIKFNDFVDMIYNNDKFDNNGYDWLLQKSDKIQNMLMLAGLGVIDYQYMGLYYKNMLILLNFLGEIANVKYAFMSDHPMLRFQSQLCHNSFVRYNGICYELLENHKKLLFNPFACLSMGIRVIISWPVNILSSIGVISKASVTRIINGNFIKILGGILSLLAIVSAIMTIFIDWEIFIEKFKMLF